MNLEALTADEVFALDREKTPIFLPIGSSEQHGPHLPLGTKSFIAEALAFEATLMLKKEGFTPIVAPTFPYAPCHESFGLPSNFPISPRVFSDLVFEIGQAFQREGFKWFFVINTIISPECLKGIEIANDDLNKEGNFRACEPLSAWIFSHKPLIEEFLLQVGVDPNKEIHADAKETGALRFLDESLVKSDILENLTPFKINLSWETLKGNFSFHEMGAQDGFIGTPKAGTKELGKLFLEEGGIVLANAVRLTVQNQALPVLPFQVRMLLKMIDLDDM